VGPDVEPVFHTREVEAKCSLALFPRSVGSPWDWRDPLLPWARTPARRCPQAREVRARSTNRLARPQTAPSSWSRGARSSIAAWVAHADGSRILGGRAVAVAAQVESANPGTWSFCGCGLGATHVWLERIHRVLRESGHSELSARTLALPEAAVASLTETSLRLVLGNLPIDIVGYPYSLLEATTTGSSGFPVASLPDLATMSWLRPLAAVFAGTSGICTRCWRVACSRSIRRSTLDATRWKSIRRYFAEHPPAAPNRRVQRPSAV
jgi:hypothetical protein